MSIKIAVRHVPGSKKSNKMVRLDDGSGSQLWMTPALAIAVAAKLVMAANQATTVTFRIYPPLKKKKS